MTQSLTISFYLSILLYRKPKSNLISIEKKSFGCWRFKWENFTAKEDKQKEVFQVERKKNI